MCLMCFLLLGAFRWIHLIIFNRIHRVVLNVGQIIAHFLIVDIRLPMILLLLDNKARVLIDLIEMLKAIFSSVPLESLGEFLKL